MQRHETYSRVIYWLKLFLPLVALVIMSTLFLVSESVTVADVFKVGPPPKAQTMPTPLRKTAEKGVHIIDFDFSGLLRSDDLRIRSLEADLDLDAQYIMLRGEVSAVSAAGWQIESDTLRANLDGSAFVAQTRVTVRDEKNVIFADTMFMRKKPNFDDKYLVNFQGAVTMVFGTDL